MSTLSKLGVFATTILTTAAAVCIYAPVDTKTSAADGVDVTFTVNPRISLTLEANNLNFNVNTTREGKFVSGDIVAYVDTSSTGGYKLQFAADDDDTAARAVNSSTPIKSDFSGSVTSITMPKDKWGWSLNNIQFGTIPAASSPEQIRNLDHHPSTEETENHVFIGAKLSNDLDSGVYHKTLIFTATANDDLPTPSGNTMQGFDPSTLAVGETRTITDTRDGNTYRVKKYPDGTVWMTDNLRIAGTVIDFTNSNLEAGMSYTIPASNLNSITDTDDLEATYTDATNGTYYSFKAATAGWGTSTVSSGNSPIDICPKGWMIPTFDHYFRVLDTNDDSYVADSNFVNSGYIARGTFTEQSKGYLWTSTVTRLDSAYLINTYTDSIMGNSFGTKYLAATVRCVAKETDSGKTMQGFDPSTLAIYGSSTTLTDTRDNSIYKVRRLSDGNVWMTENLRITNKRITNRDSNIQSSSWQIPQSDSLSFTQTAESPGVYTDPNHMGIISGAYYTFYSATAGVGNASANGRVTQDICPKGWRLPTKSEYVALYFYYDSLSALRDYDGPYYWLTGYTLNQGNANHSIFHPNDSKDYGYYWSSLAASDGKAYVLYLDDKQKRIDPEYSELRSYGFSIRCIADTNNQASQTMQTFNPNALANTGDTAILTDERDNNKYTVRRLADGRVWMVDNLRIAGKTITSADSNLPSGSSFTIPSSSASGFGFDTAGVYIDSDYGGYYNFYAATAGWGTGTVTSGNSPKDICPKGWHLPVGGNNGYNDYERLQSYYGNLLQMQNLPHFQLGGYMTNLLSPTDRGNVGAYWTSTASGSERAWNMTLRSDYEVGTVDQETLYKPTGFSVRCVAN